MNTPAYLFNKNELISCYKKIKLLMGNIPIHYALKANANIEVLNILKSINADFEVASVGEFETLISIGVDPEKIICGLPITPLPWLQEMYEYGCRYFVFDTISELKKLQNHAPLAKKILRISIYDIIPNNIGFGMPISEINENINKKESFLKDKIDGISFHISENTDIDNFNLVIDRIDKLFFHFSKPNMWLNIGGGYRIYADYDFFENLNTQIKNLNEKYTLKVIAEPGNTIVNSSGSIRTKVIGIKKLDDINYYLYIDAGKPTGIKTDGKRIPTYIKQITKSQSCKRRTYTLIDVTCMHRPHFSFSSSSVIKIGDVLEFGGMGAYTLCLRSDFHLWSDPSVHVV